MPEIKHLKISPNSGDSNGDGHSDLGSEFQAVRDKFAQEMKNMEADMDKYRTSMLAQASKIGSRRLSPNSLANSPLICESKDGKILKLKFDVTEYKPEEIAVKTVDNKLLVHAKHEEKTNSKSVYKEYSKEFLLPDGTNAELLKSSLSGDGLLVVEVPLPETEVRNIKIQKD